MKNHTGSMDLVYMLRSTSKPQYQADIVQYACGHKSHFLKLMECFFSGDLHLSHRAGLVILEVAKLEPSWVEEQVPLMVDTLNKDLPDWYKRNILRMLEKQRIPETRWGRAADQCFKFLASDKEPVAVKAFSMTVIYNLTKEHPDLAHELRLLIEEQYDFSSAGFKARGRNILKLLDKDGR